MSVFSNILSALTSSGAVDPASQVPTDPNASTNVQPLMVTAPKKPDSAPQHDQSVEYNYNNSQASNAVNNAVAGEGTPPGGSANPGIYGLLPQHLQHGTLRNVLGAIGDAFLVQSGNAPQYRPRMERQQIGQAMAGYNPDDPASVQAAIQRVAATGAPDSIDLADRMQKNYTDAQQRKATMEENTRYHDEQTSNRRATTFSTMAPRVEGLMHNVNDPTEYNRKYQIADGIAKRVDPDADATSAFGLVPPDQWQPGMDSGYGMTSNQYVVSEDKGKQRATSERNTDVNAGSRIKSAQINAGGHVQAAVISADKATGAAILQGLIAKQNSGQKLTPAEQAAFDHYTQVGKKHATLPPNVLVGGNTKPKFENGRVYQDAHGNKAKYMDGKWIPQ